MRKLNARQDVTLVELELVPQCLSLARRIRVTALSFKNRRICPRHLFGSNACYRFWTCAYPIACIQSIRRAQDCPH